VWFCWFEFVRSSVRDLKVLAAIYALVDCRISELFVFVFGDPLYDLVGRGVFDLKNSVN